MVRVGKEMPPVELQNELGNETFEVVTTIRNSQIHSIVFRQDRRS